MIPSWKRSVAFDNCPWVVFDHSAHFRVSVSEPEVWMIVAQIIRIFTLKPPISLTTISLLVLCSYAKEQCYTA